MAKEKKHILVVRLSAMGDVAMVVPVVKALIQQNPNLRLTIVTRSFFEPFFTNIPNVTVFAPKLKGKHKGFLGIRKLSKELAALQIDAVADLHNVLRSNLLIRFLKLKGIPFEQIDKGRAEKKALTKTKNKVFKQLPTTHKRYADVFEKLGYSIDLSKGIVKTNTVKPEFLQHIDGKVIGIAPFAAHKGKMLPIEKTKALIYKLSERKDVSILIFGGGKKEKEIVESIRASKGNIYNMVGRHSFVEELQIISNLDLMVSMDSGNGHIAAMYGIPVITIWGVTHPYLGFTPFNQPESNQIIPNLEAYPEIPTSVYGKKYPETSLGCFDTIEQTTIVKRIEELLS